MKMRIQRSRLAWGACCLALICCVPAAYAAPSWNTLDTWEASLLPEKPLGMETLSTISAVGTLTLPVPGIIASSASLQRSLSYGLSLAAAYGAKELGKHLFQRPRPDNPDERDSFPSGHAAASGAVLGYMTYYLRHDPIEPSWPLWASVPLHALTLSGRLLSRQHYPLDIIAGVLLGGAVGYAVPWLLDL